MYLDLRAALRCRQERKGRVEGKKGRRRWEGKTNGEIWGRD